MQGLFRKLRGGVRIDVENAEISRGKMCQRQGAAIDKLDPSLTLRLMNLPPKFQSQHSGTPPRMESCLGGQRTHRIRRWSLAFALAAWGLATSARAQSADSFNPGASSNVLAFAVQTDGRILVGGAFTNLAGQRRLGLGRLNSDGTLDTNFTASISGGAVHCLAVQTDGRMLVGGTFTNLSGQAVTNFGRLNTNGTPDASFAGGANSNVYCLTLQTDGKILVGGEFTQLGGQSRTKLGRVLADGTPDADFMPAATGGYVNCILPQPDGKFLVGGGFTNLAGLARTNLGRLNADGTGDTGFVASANSDVYTLALQTDGKTLVGGKFSQLRGVARANLGRLHPDGSLDTNFTTTANGPVYCLAAQADGRVLVGGAFTTLGGQSRASLGRLNADGSVDYGSWLSTDGTPFFVALQEDGGVLVGGTFTKLGGFSRRNLGRLTNPTAATQGTAFDGSVLRWERGGSSPEVWRATLDSSMDGENWISHGAGLRVTGGWEWTGVSVPTNATFRGRGFIAAQQYNGSEWFAQTLTTVEPLSITQQPADRTNNAGTTATFSVAATGMPFTYQ